MKTFWFVFDLTITSVCLNLLTNGVKKHEWWGGILRQLFCILCCSVALTRIPSLFMVHSPFLCCHVIEIWMSLSLCFWVPSVCLLIKLFLGGAARGFPYLLSISLWVFLLVLCFQSVSLETFNWKSSFAMMLDFLVIWNVYFLMYTIRNEKPSGRLIITRRHVKRAWKPLVHFKDLVSTTGRYFIFCTCNGISPWCLCGGFLLPLYPIKQLAYFILASFVTVDEKKEEKSLFKGRKYLACGYQLQNFYCNLFCYSCYQAPMTPDSGHVPPCQDNRPALSSDKWGRSTDTPLLARFLGMQCRIQTF